MCSLGLVWGVSWDQPDLGLPPKKEKSPWNSLILVFQVEGPRGEKYVFYILLIAVWTFWESEKENWTFIVQVLQV